MRPDKPARVFGYPRVSARDQGERGTSLDAQSERLRAWCDERGYPAPILFPEIQSGVEEKRERRVEYDKLLAQVQTGDLIVVTTADRAGRDIVDLLRTVRDLVRRGIGWIAIDEEIDASTTRGMEALENRAVGAQQEARRIRTRTVGARQRLKDAGYWVEGPAPPGYRRGPRALRRQNLLDVAAGEAAMMVGAFERCAAGASLDDLEEHLTEEMDRPVYRHTIRNWMRSRVFLGEVKDSQGRWIKGRHEAIVSRDLWERAQAGLDERRKGGRKPGGSSRTASWLLRGIASCPDCGARMGASFSRVQAGGYYACARRLRPGSCSAPYARVDLADARAAERALARLVELRHELARPGGAAAAVPRSRNFDAARTKIAGQLARAEDLCVRGVVSEDALARTRERLDGELGRLAVAEAAAARVERAGDPLARRARLAEVEMLTAAWGRASVDIRRTALALLARSIRIYPDHVEIDWYTADELCTTTGPAHLFAAPDAAPSGSRESRGRR